MNINTYNNINRMVSKTEKESYFMIVEVDMKVY